MVTGTTRIAGTMGRPAKPTAMLRLSGNLRGGRHADRVREPKPPPGLPVAPAWLLPEALAEWNRVCAAYGALGILCPLDRGMLATYATMWARFAAAEQATPYIGLPASWLSVMAGIASRLGLDPSGRTRLRTPDPEVPPGSPWDKLGQVLRRK